MTIATIYISDMHLFTHGLNIQPNSDHRDALAKRLDRQLTQFKPITAVSQHPPVPTAPLRRPAPGTRPVYQHTRHPLREDEATS